MARSEDERVVLMQLIVGVVEVASGALVQSRRPPSRTSSDLDTRFVFFLAARAAAASDTVHLANLARLFVRGSVWRPSLLIWSTSSLGRRRLCVVATPAFAGRLLKLGRRMKHTEVQLRLRDSQILANLLKRKSASVHDKVGDIPGCGGAGCGNVAEKSICRVICGHLCLTCVEMYNIFRRLDKINFKFPHRGFPEGSWLIDRRVEVARPALLWLLNSNSCCKCLILFYRLRCS